MNKPFLKWMGGKTRIIDRIRAVLPPGQRLVEPFVGSGAVFLNVDYEKYLLADSNEILINLYNALSFEKGFIKLCESFFTEDNNTKEQYKRLRGIYNTTSDKIEKSAIFVYLNRFGFNGVCRHNSKGEFNVPFRGEKWGMPYFPKKELINFWNKCESKSVEFKHYDFRETFKRLKEGDVVYCDPPYIPLSETSSFTAYDVDGFTETDQQDLARSATDAKVPVIISNHDAPIVKELYNDAKFIHRFEVGRSVGGAKDSRKKAIEILAVFNSEYGKPRAFWEW
jgi:DNA adenine methylase